MKPNKYLCIALSCGLLCLAVNQFALAQQVNKPEKSSEQKSNPLDDELLDNLSEGLEEKPNQGNNPKKSQRQSPKKSANTKPDLDKQLLDDLSESDQQQKNTKQAEESDPLENIKKQMLTAKKLLIEKKSGIKTQRSQEKVIADLDKLIEKIRQQATKSSRIASADKKQAKPSQQDSKKKTTAGTGEPNSSASRQSDTQSGRKGPRRNRVGNRKSLLEEYWGHLPLHLRQQMPQNPNGKFLPKYELEIEEYFRRLLEQQFEK